MNLKAMATPAALEPGLLVTRYRSLTVANVDSINRPRGAGSRGIGLWGSFDVNAAEVFLKALDEVFVQVAPVPCDMTSKIVH